MGGKYTRRDVLRTGVQVGMAIGVGGLLGCATRVDPAGTGAPAPAAAPAPAVPAAPPGPRNLGGSVSLYMNGVNASNREAVEKALEPFTKATGIKIEGQEQPTSGGATARNEKLRLMIATNSVDAWKQDGTVPAYVSQQIPEPLNTYIERDKVDTSIFSKAALNLHTYQGKIYTIPHDCYAQCLAYNPDLFDMANVPYPPTSWEDTSWTMDEFISRAQRLTKFEGATMVQAGSFNMNQFYFPWYYGQSFVSPDGKKMNTTNSEFIRALRVLQDMFVRHKIAPNADQVRAMNLPQGVTNPFLAGKAAMTVVATADVTALRRIEGLKWKLAAMPRGTITFGNLDVGGYAMIQSSKEKDRTWELLRWSAQPENGLALANAFGRPPALSAELSNWVKAQEAINPGTGFKVWADVIEKYSQPADVIEKYSQPAEMQAVRNLPNYRDLFDNVLSKGMANVITGSQTPEEVGRWMQEEGDKILSK